MGVFVVLNKSKSYPLGYVIQENGCWDWIGSKGSHGYGQAWDFDKKTVVLSHRYVYEIEVGPIPEGLTLDHLCRNKSCCNPAHLEPVTMRVNSLRGIGRSAINAAKTHCPKGHQLADDNLTTRSFTGRRGRECVVCRRYYARIKSARSTIVDLLRRELLVAHLDRHSLQPEGAEQTRLVRYKNLSVGCLLRARR